YPTISPASNTALHQPDKVVLVTGAGRGIGRSIVLQYAHAGVACIILCARTGSELNEVESAIKEITPEVRILKYTIDATSEEGVANIAQEVEEKEGRLDILINNAGYSSPWVPIASTNPTSWWSTFEVNLKAPYLFLHAFLPLLTATAEKYGKGANVINLSSVGAHVVMPDASAYQTSKFAVLRLGEFVHAEYSAKGVTCVAVNPGGVPTALSTQEERLKPFLNDTPDLCGGFLVWLTAKERKWLGGRYVSATWDADVLEGMEGEIVEGDMLVVKMVV
ncbi:putative oxidoreductase ucpA, partial [Setomelanomma holmii]